MSLDSKQILHGLRNMWKIRCIFYQEKFIRFSQTYEN